MAQYYLQKRVVEGIGVSSLFGRVTRPPPTTSPAPTPPPNTPAFITKYISEIKTNNYLSNRDIIEIFTSAGYANGVKSVTKRSELIDYLKLLKKQLDISTTPPLPQMTFFCISIPSAFNLFYMPDPTADVNNNKFTPVPYNKLHGTMVDIFPNSIPYSKIQIMCILWKQVMFLFNPSGPIIDPRNDTFNEIINSYIKQINNIIIELNSFYKPREKNM